MAKRVQIKIFVWVALAAVAATLVTIACSGRATPTGECAANKQDDCESAGIQLADETANVKTCIWFDSNGNRSIDQADPRVKDYDIPLEIALSGDQVGVGACLSYVKVQPAGDLEAFRKLVEDGQIKECRLLNVLEACVSRNVTRDLKDASGNPIECAWNATANGTTSPKCVPVSDAELAARQALRDQIDLKNITECVGIVGDGAGGVCEDDMDPARSGWNPRQCRYRDDECKDFPESGTPNKCEDVKPVDTENCASGLLDNHNKPLNCAPGQYYATPTCVTSANKDIPPFACNLRNLPGCLLDVTGAPKKCVPNAGKCDFVPEPGAPI